MAPDLPPKPTTPDSQTAASTPPMADTKKDLIPSPPPMHPPLPPSIASPSHARPPPSQAVNGLPHSETTTALLHNTPPQTPPQPDRIRSSNLSPSPFPDNDEEDEWTMPHRSTIYMIWLSLVMAGIQFSWSVELAYISPYLLSLGLPKSTLSLVWVAGPVSGIIGQPVIGMLSDRSKFKWGRRRIFIVLSTIGVVLGFIGMGRTRGIVRWWTGRRDWESTRHSVVVLAIASLIILDVAVNATTAAARALIVDSVPTPQQNTANAWAGRMLGLGNVLGYLSGYTNLPKYFPSLGETQFQILCVLAPVFLVITVIITCTAVKEVDPALLFVFPGQENEQQGGIQAAISVIPPPFLVTHEQMLTSISRLPPRVRQICNIQFFAFLGWFLFLIWNTTYTGEIYVRTYLRTHPPPQSRREDDLLWDDATRIASFALLLESFVSLLANLVLPLFLRGRLRVPGLTLRRYWIASHVLFGLLMWSTLFIVSVEGAVAMVATVGLCWALTLWAPFALISQCVSHINDVSRRESIANSRIGTPDLRPLDGSPYGAVEHVSPLPAHGISVSNPDERRPSQSTPLLAPTPFAPRHTTFPSPEDALPATSTEKKEEITSAGTIMGLHNVFISSPQFISTLVASVIFHFLGAGGRGDDIDPSSVVVDPATETRTGGSIGWVLRVGGLGGFIAAYLTWHLAEEVDAFGCRDIDT